MGQSIENGAALQEFSDKSQISGERQRTLLLGTEKKESKKLKTFQKLLKQISQSPQYNRAGTARTVQEMFKRKLTKIKNQVDISGNTGTIPK